MEFADIQPFEQSDVALQVVDVQRARRALSSSKLKAVGTEPRLVRSKSVTENTRSSS